MSLSDTARELGESEQLVRWLVEEGRLPYPPTLSALRRYREECSGGERIQPGTLGHLTGRKSRDQ